MATEAFKTSYQQYKEDTDAVASWLARTAKACGYAVDLLTGQDAPQAPRRHKGKASKQAQKPREAPTSTNAKVPTYTIAIKDFVSLADWIASYTKRSIHIPSSFVDAIGRAISVRKNHGEQLSGRNRRSDERHNYFIGVLEHVRDALRPRMSADLLADGQSSNRFDGLEGEAEVEPVSAEPLQASSVSSNGPTKSADIHYEAERDDTEEAYLAFILMLEDYNKYKAVISKSWYGYLQGAFDLVSVSTMTNTAIDIARRLEEDAKPLFDNHGCSERLLQAHWLASCEVHGEKDSARERPDDEINFRMYEVSQTFFWPTYLFLQAFGEVIEPGYMPIMKPGYFGVYDPAANRSEMSAREKFKEDRALLCGVLPEFFITCYGTQSITAEDGLTQGLRTAFKTKEYPLWLVFAAQIYLDIHHIMRGNAARGLHDLQKLGMFVNKSIEANLRFHESLRIENWPRSNDRVFKLLQEQIDEEVMNDPLPKKKARMGYPPEMVGQPFEVMKSHPLRCGLYAYNIKIRYQELAVAFVNAWGSILYSYHLYNAASSQNLLRHDWQDMNIIMGFQDVFSEGAPADLDDCSKRFALSIGVSATAFANNKREGNRRVPAAKGGPRGLLKELAPVALAFKDRYCNDSGRSDLTEQDLQNIVAGSMWQEDHIAKELSNMGVLSLARDTKKEKAARAKQDITHNKPTAVELLESLRNTLQSEKVELDFDYLLFHRMVWPLLRSIQEACDPKLKEMCGPGYLEKENQLPFVVGYILMAGAETKRTAGALKMKSNEVTSKLLQQAATVMEVYIEKIGKLVLTMMEKQHGVKIKFESKTEQDE